MTVTAPVITLTRGGSANKRKFKLDREFYQKLQALKTLGVDTAVFEKNFDRVRGQQQKSFLRTFF